MSTLKILRTGTGAAVRTGVSLALAIAVGSASAQSAAGAERASADAPVKNEAASPAVKQHDPFSPFVWDVLGATPSIRLPGQRSAAPAKPVAPERVPATSTPQPSASIERTETAAR